jgi:nicotinamidase-related amidase
VKLEKDRCVGVLIDVQERLHPHMQDAASVEAHCRTLLDGLAVLGVPVVATEQYPKGLGTTVRGIDAALEAAGATRVEKIEFSCFANPGFRESLRRTGRRQVILMGIEAHVCVLQTAIDLVSSQHDVLVAVDCTSSRSQRDAEIAFRRMESEGVRLGTYESILLELCHAAGTPSFKEISRLIK